MKEMPLISVILPVYRVEKYLDRCLQSVTEQTYRNLEIILVDDGSPDRSGELCDAWAAKDSRIKVIHQENTGGGAARNAALDIATGAWIGFVDSDDYIAPYMLEYLHSLMDQETDIAECSYMDVTQDDALFPDGPVSISFWNTQTAMEAHLRDRFFRQLIWNKLYRREVIGDIRFPVGTKIDDEFFTYRVLGNAKRLVLSNRVCYAYRQQPESVMHSQNVSTRLQGLRAKTERCDYLGEHFPELLAMARAALWFSCLYNGQLFLQQCPQGQCTDAFGALRAILNNYPLLPYSGSVKERIWLTLAKVSFAGTCRLRNLLGIGL
jgi:glycosyltransferase involved in cell wall biosynthesis